MFNNERKNKKTLQTYNTSKKVEPVQLFGGTSIEADSTCEGITSTAATDYSSVYAGSYTSTLGYNISTGAGLWMGPLSDSIITMQRDISDLKRNFNLEYCIPQDAISVIVEAINNLECDRVCRNCKYYRPGNIDPCDKAYRIADELVLKEIVKVPKTPLDKPPKM